MSPSGSQFEATTVELSRPDPGSKVSVGTGLLSGGLGAFFFCGWLLFGETASQWLGHRMKTNTSLCLTVLAAALILLARPKRRPWLEWTFIVTPAALAAATLVEYLGGVDLGIDQLLARDFPSAEALGWPNRMAPNAALSFVLLAGALALSRGPNLRRALVGQGLALAVMTLSLLALVGYLYEATVLYQPTRFLGISPYTAAGTGVLGIGVLALRPDLGLSRLMVSRGSGGYLIRPLLVLAIFAPILLGWLRLVGERLGYYDTNTGTSLLVLLTLGTFVAVVVALARSLERVDVRRRQAETELRRSADLTAALARAATVEEVAGVTLRLGLPALGASSGGVMLISADGQELHMASAQGYAEGVVASYRAIAVASDLPAAEALRTQRPIFVASAEEYHRRFPSIAPDSTAASQSWAALPIQGRERIIGVLGLSFREAQDFSEPERERLARLAWQCGQALDRALLFDSQKEARDRERRARENAEDASRAKDEFLAMLGHELRNPLSPMLTALQLMKMRANDAHLKERAIIERQVQHMVRLVDDLLDVSRITQGKIELKRQRLALGEVVARAVELASPLFEQRQHRLHVEVAPGLTVIADEHRLTQVVSNLLTNAAKYTNPGGDITVTAVADAVSGQATIRVTDSGIGMGAELLPRVFDQFVQGYRTPERSAGGLGLGLAIVKMLVEMHGGRVAAESDGPGRGSRFSVHLPLAAAEAVGVARPSAPPSGAAPTPGPEPVRRRVLVVDDNRDAAELLAEALTMEGHDVRIAFDGPDALVAAAELKPDLAFLDIGLPVMDGYELARRLRALDSTSPPLTLVAITGYGQAANRARSAEAGFDQHLVKPIELEAALAIVQRRAREPAQAAAGI